MSKKSISVFPYELFCGAVEDWLRKKDYWCGWAVWERAKASVHANARIDYAYDIANTAESREEALGKAWEDLVNAFCGYGSNQLNGLVADLFFALPDQDTSWPEFSEELTRVIAKIEAKLDANDYPRRYTKTLRDAGAIKGPTRGAFKKTVVQKGGYPYHQWQRRYKSQTEIVQAQDTNVIPFRK